jgi:ABC-type antimicrobial peptide transport system permease subunit
MAKEPVKIIIRRFTGRLLESGLLILAVALGVGAAASGLSLLLHTNEYSRNMLDSPTYRELIITTQDNADDMTVPMIENVKGDDVILTIKDLSAAELVPQVSYAYISNKTRMRFMNEEFLNRKSGENPGEPPPEGAGPEGDNDFFRNMEENLKAAKEDSNIILPQIDELYGFSITPQYFDARNMNTIAGSLFTDSDLSSTTDFVVLGTKAAELINENDEPLENLIGKKILSFNTYYTIVGILEETDSLNDEMFFTLDKQTGAGGGSNFFNHEANRQLRFTVSDPEDLDDASQLLISWFENTYGEGQIVISNPREEAEKLVKRNKGISYLILFLSLAGLFIASVNISNILMSRTLRMKKHVGILKALGATNNDILKLFSSEALVITIIGALVGTVMAFPLSKAMETAMDLDQGSWLFIIAAV